MSKELEEEVQANRQRAEHMSRAHEQQLRDLQQVWCVCVALLPPVPPLTRDCAPQTASQREAELLQR